MYKYIKSNTYKYCTKHGIGPGTLPKDVTIIDWEEPDDYRTILWLNRELTSEEQDYYDIHPVKIRKFTDDNVYAAYDDPGYTSYSDPRLQPPEYDEPDIVDKEEYNVKVIFDHDISVYPNEDFDFTDPDTADSDMIDGNVGVNTQGEVTLWDYNDGVILPDYGRSFYRRCNGCYRTIYTC